MSTHQMDSNSNVFRPPPIPAPREMKEQPNRDSPHPDEVGVAIDCNDIINMLNQETAKAQEETGTFFQWKEKDETKQKQGAVDAYIEVDKDASPLPQRTTLEYTTSNEDVIEYVVPEADNELAGERGTYVNVEEGAEINVDAANLALQLEAAAQHNLCKGPSRKPVAPPTHSFQHRNLSDPQSRPSSSVSLENVGQALMKLDISVQDGTASPLMGCVSPSNFVYDDTALQIAPDPHTLSLKASNAKFFHARTIAKQKQSKTGIFDDEQEQDEEMLYEPESVKIVGAQGGHSYLNCEFIKTKKKCCGRPSFKSKTKVAKDNGILSGHKMWLYYVAGKIDSWVISFTLGSIKGVWAIYPGSVLRHMSRSWRVIDEDAKFLKGNKMLAALPDMRLQRFPPPTNNRDDDNLSPMQ